MARRRFWLCVDEKPAIRLAYARCRRPSRLRPSGNPSLRRRFLTAEMVLPVRFAASLADNLAINASCSAVQERPAAGGHAPRRFWASLIFRRFSTECDLPRCPLRIASITCGVHDGRRRRDGR
jgi:hypothetical protein